MYFMLYINCHLLAGGVGFAKRLRRGKAGEKAMVFEEVEEAEIEEVAVDDEQRDPDFQMEEGGGVGGGEAEDEEDEEEEMEIVVQERAGRGMSRKGGVRGERKRRPTTRKSKKEMVSYFYQPYFYWLYDNDWVHN